MVYIKLKYKSQFFFGDPIEKREVRTIQRLIENGASINGWEEKGFGEELRKPTVKN